MPLPGNKQLDLTPKYFYVKDNKVESVGVSTTNTLLDELSAELLYATSPTSGSYFYYYDFRDYWILFYEFLLGQNTVMHLGLYSNFLYVRLNH